MIESRRNGWKNRLTEEYIQERWIWVIIRPPFACRKTNTKTDNKIRPEEREINRTRKSKCTRKYHFRYASGNKTACIGGALNIGLTWLESSSVQIISMCTTHDGDSACLSSTYPTWLRKGSLCWTVASTLTRGVTQETSLLAYQVDCWSDSLQQRYNSFSCMKSLDLCKKTKQKETTWVWGAHFLVSCSRGTWKTLQIFIQTSS